MASGHSRSQREAIVANTAHDQPDYRVTLTPEGGTGEYRLTFGSYLRPGVLHETDPETLAGDASTGRETGGRYAIDGPHTWVASGPIRLQNTGDTVVGVAVNGGQTLRVAPGGSLSTSCPTERKRHLALATVGGGMLGMAAGALRDR